MRVISGSARGLKLSSPSGIDTRPTLDRVKEAVFSSILPYIGDAVVLDAFSGSGALGIEALSRGARYAVFADNNKNAVRCIKENICAARVLSFCEVYEGSVFDFLKTAKKDKMFDIVFLDPPYASGFYTPFLTALNNAGILVDDAIIVAEWSRDADKPDFTPFFDEIKTKAYGRVCVTILKRGAL